MVVQTVQQKSCMRSQPPSAVLATQDTDSCLHMLFDLSSPIDREVTTMQPAVSLRQLTLHTILDLLDFCTEENVT